MYKSNILLFSFFFAFTSIHSNTENYQSTQYIELSKEIGISITESYLKEHPLKTIRQSVPTKQFDKQLPVITKMIAKEKETGFFGYHGCSQRYRIFQDILRVVFEEALRYDLPNDFQFLRIPGDKLFDLKDGKLSFYQLFDRKEPAKSIKIKIVDTLFISPFNEDFGYDLQTSDLEDEDLEELWDVAQEFIEILDSLAMEDYFDYEFEDEKHAHAHSLQEESDPSSSNAYMLSIRKILDMIKQKIESQEQINSRAGPSESMAKLHAVFMRILNKKIKNIDSDQVKSQISLHYKFRTLFSRVEQLYSQVSEEALWDFFFPYNDHKPGQQSRIICLNIPLFGNYYRPGESSIHVFLDGYSIAGGDDAVIKLLSTFFAEIGLDKKLPEALQKIALTELKKPENKYGSMLQFFDLSEKNGKTAYKGADASAYVSHSYGIPLKHLEPSQIILNEHPIERNKLDLQLRLIPCNHTTLNPYSFLRVIRHDSQKPEVSKKILIEMRKRVKSGIVDVKKLNAYKAKMDAIWNL